MDGWGAELQQLARAEDEQALTNVRYEYVRSFEQPDILLSNTWIVVRIDGRGFSKYVAFCFFRLSIALLFAKCRYSWNSPRASRRNQSQQELH